MMISRLCARLAARASFTKPFEGYYFDYGTLQKHSVTLKLNSNFNPFFLFIANHSLTESDASTQNVIPFATVSLAAM